MTKDFIITGMVLGNLWMGGVGSYPMQRITATTRKKALDEAKKRLKNNKLTGTGDFNGEVGAMLRIECIRKGIISGREYTNSEVEPMQVIGVVTADQIEFLLETAEF